MFFLNSIQFWGTMAAVGVAVPVVIHLLSRYRSRVVDWAAMELLRRALVVRARRVRMEDLLLLLLRCLALALMAFALARPVVRESTWIGDSNVGVVIAIDASFSMGHNASGESRYDAARLRAREIVATLSPGDSVTIIQLADRAVLRLENVPLNDERLDEFLAGSSPLPEALNLDACLPELRRVVDELKTPKKEVYLITDGQAATWASLSAGVNEAFQELAVKCELAYVPVGAEASANLAVTRLALASGVLRKGLPARYTVEVRNTGREAVADVPVELLVDGRRVSRQSIDRIEPDQTATVGLLADFPEEGSFSVTARLDKQDPLPVDDSRFAVAAVRSKVRLLCVEPEPSAEVMKNETGYLYGVFVGNAAANKGGVAAAPVDWKAVAASQLDSTALAGQDVVILANVAEVSRQQALALGEFVARGGGMIVFLGGRTDASVMNSQMRDADGRELLPASLGEPVGQTSETLGPGGGAAPGWTLAADGPDHPVTRFAAALPRQLWEEARFHRYFRVAPHGDARVLLSLAASGDPILVEKPLGRGGVLLFTSTANRAWNELPVNPAYLMLMQQAVTYLTRQSSDATATVGQDIAWHLPAEGTSAKEAAGSLVRGPDGRELAVQFSTDAQGLRDAVVRAGQPGVYAMKGPGGGPEVKMAANVDVRESSVVVVRGRSLVAVTAGMSARLIEPGQDIRQTIGDSRRGRELWRTLLMIALAVLATEALLARWFGHRLAEESGDQRRPRPGARTVDPLGAPQGYTMTTAGR